MSTLGQKTLAVAITQLGVEEIPKNSNAGPAVEKYLKSVGLGKGYAWCMAFVYWCTKEASLQLAIANPLTKTAGVLAMLNFEKDLVVKEPQPGDIFIMDFGKGQGHTGIVEKVDKNIIHTIEGNTNDDGSREGYKVCRRIRSKSTIKAYLRL
ncbi:CHAP domain-containing protein [Flavobacterium hydrophilum]|uniref:CHAP domain-containing protein n=1 Tax=Flavobacterium hydrophilum TaxID=2211445 RepID=A0A2V4C3N5_9FLAO|nr:CHAP domain-containing protein [Flavobacterium hydrophilum]PXY44520.1 CHAP domain-containing protein [Flavobacterium hydrophilum]